MQLPVNQITVISDDEPVNRDQAPEHNFSRMKVCTRYCMITLSDTYISNSTVVLFK